MSSPTTRSHCRRNKGFAVERQTPPPLPSTSLPRSPPDPETLFSACAGGSCDNKIICETLASTEDDPDDQLHKAENPKESYGNQGTLFSRRDSFITHRAFCDSLAEHQTQPQNQNQNQSRAVANPNSDSDPKVQAMDSSPPPESAPSPTPAPAPTQAPSPPVQVSAPTAPALPLSTSVTSSVLPIQSSGEFYNCLIWKYLVLLVTILSVLVFAFN